MNALPSLKTKRMIKFENHPLLKNYGNFEDISEVTVTVLQVSFLMVVEALENIQTEVANNSVSPNTF